ncbi:MAG TPA: RnfABCDGE type electron transport complex subunit D [Candidatus Limnocylindrales bacterium]|nr:RnfABCDGE type electron transport complex subunit D [Candidatus Limnocylindrales bacterium]
MTARALTFGGTSYPLILPNVRDPRLHVAAVIITVHVLGQVGLHFNVSVPQILAAILTCAILEVALTFRQTRSFVWPASAMLTGSGVALILRVVGTPPDDPWNTYAWYVFAGVAAFSLLTKYVIKYKGSHVFNPSNIGLVVAFLVLGSTRVEPLDFWWAPLDIWMITAYAVIIGGGLLITRRLKLLELAAMYWITLAVGSAVLAGSGHCMTANWAFAPVCGADFWRVIVTSPEVLIFLFFMITDPKTVPAGRVGRVVFAFLVGVLSVLLMAPQTDEWGTKVGLLSSLVVVCAARPILDRLVPEPRSAADDLWAFGSRLATGGRAGVGALGKAARVGVMVALLLAIGAGIVLAGTPARGTVAANTGDVLDRVPHQVDPATFPTITVDPDVSDWNHEIAGDGARAIVLTLAENLELENQALLRRDESILPAVDHGDRLAELQAKLREAGAGGQTVITRYRFDSLNMSLIEPFGVQTGLSLGLEAGGTMVEETYDAAGTLVGSREAAFARTFVMRRATGDRWLNIAVLHSAGG